jgi:hypothetical protein
METAFSFVGISLLKKPLRNITLSWLSIINIKIASLGKERKNV